MSNDPNNKHAPHKDKQHELPKEQAADDKAASNASERPEESSKGAHAEKSGAHGGKKAARHEAEGADKKGGEAASGEDSSFKGATNPEEVVSEAAKPSEPVVPPVDEKEQARRKSEEAEQRERKLQQSLLETELKVLKLESEMRQLNEQYMKKMTEKATEAQKVVNKRLAELQEEFAADAAEAKRYALKTGGAKLAEVVQQFDMVLSTSQKASDAVKGYAQGFAMVFDLMVKTLAELGIKEIAVKPGDHFDHATMEIFEGVDSKEFKHNQVVEVLKKGYRLHDLVIAHAVVRVAN